MVKWFVVSHFIFHGEMWALRGFRTYKWKNSLKKCVFCAENCWDNGSQFRLSLRILTYITKTCQENDLYELASFVMWVSLLECTNPIRFIYFRFHRKQAGVFDFLNPDIVPWNVAAFGRHQFPRKRMFYITLCLILQQNMQHIPSKNTISPPISEGLCTVCK